MKQHLHGYCNEGILKRMQLEYSGKNKVGLCGAQEMFLHKLLRLCERGLLDVCKYIFCNCSLEEVSLFTFRIYEAISILCDDFPFFWVGRIYTDAH